MAKSPFSKKFLQVCFVSGPEGDQHIFIGFGTSRQAFSMCGMSADKIHTDPNGYVDVTESRDRLPDRPVCAKCEAKWKAHPASPWKAWGGVKAKA